MWEDIQSYLLEFIAWVYDLVMIPIYENLVDFLQRFDFDFSELFTILARLNYIFPVAEIFASFAILFTIWVFCLIVRAVISIIPTVGG